MSSNRAAAAVLERQLGSAYEVHPALTDEAAFALLDAHPYACIVVDLCARSAAGPEVSSAIRLNALTAPVIAIIPAGEETMLPSNAVPCVTDPENMSRLVAAIKKTCR